MQGTAIDVGLLSVSYQNPPDDDNCYQMSTARLEWGTEDVYDRRWAGGMLYCQGQNLEDALPLDQTFILDVQCTLYIILSLTKRLDL